MQRPSGSEIRIGYKRPRAIGYMKKGSKRGNNKEEFLLHGAASWRVFERSPRKSAGGGVSIFSGSGLHPLSAQY